MKTPARHPVSTTHLVVGLVFLGLAVSWLLREVGVMGSDELQWALPLVLVVAGAAGLLASLAKGVTRSREDTGSWDSSPWETDSVESDTWDGR